MLKIISQVAVFIAVLSQTLLTSESTVQHANIISLVLILPYFLNILSVKKIDINLPLFMYILLSIFWITSIAWHPAGTSFQFYRLRTIILISLFLLVFTALIKRQECFISFRWALSVCIFVNFILMMLNLNNTILGQIYVGGRFVGSFLNANEAALVFFSGLIFSFYDLSSTNKFIKIIGTISICCSILLILATASKKGVLLIAITIIIFTPLYLRRLNFKAIISFFLLFSLSISIIYSFKEQLGLEQYWDKTAYRFEQFYSTLFEQSGKIKTNSGMSGNSTSQRLGLIKYGLNGFLESPIIGHGMEAFTYYTKTYAHNNYVELLFNGGLIAFFCYYFIFFWSLIKAIKIRDKQIRLLTTFPILSILLIDLAAVNYNSKLTLYVLFSCIALIDLEREKRLEHKDLNDIQVV